MLRKFASTCAIVGILAAGATAAMAQTTPDPHHPGPPAGDKQVQAQPRPSGGMMGPGMMGPGMMEKMMGNGQADMMAGCQMAGGDTSTFAEGRIAFLKAELTITDLQKAVWETYVEVLKKNLQGMQAMRQTMVKVMDAKTPVERLDAQLAAMDGRLASLKEVKPALDALYAALSAEQKKKADQILTGMGCMM